MTMKRGLERRLKERIPEIQEVVLNTLFTNYNMSLDPHQNTVVLLFCQVTETDF
jgi:Fe-S cluster biogenesis protein NfuA